MLTLSVSATLLLTFLVSGGISASLGRNLTGTSSGLEGAFSSLVTCPMLTDLDDDADLSRRSDLDLRATLDSGPPMRRRILHSRWGHRGRTGETLGGQAKTEVMAGSQWMGHLWLSQPKS